MNNEVIINQNKNDNIITFQAKGEADFLQNITSLVLNDMSEGIEKKRESLIQSYDSQKGYIGEKLKFYDKNSNIPEHYLTGIKVYDDGSQRYRCRYICPNCNTKENKYIAKYFEYIECRNCNQKLSVDWVEDTHNVEHDIFHNFACAGSFSPKFDKI